MANMYQNNGYNTQPNNQMGGQVYQQPSQMTQQPNQNNQNYTNIYGNPYPNQSYQTQPMDVRPVAAPSTQATTIKPSYILGRVVGDEKEIVAGEVPNDGTYATYIRSDLKQIYMKTWGGNGLVETKVFDLVEPSNQTINPSQPDAMQLILERLDNIEKNGEEQSSIQ